MNSELYHFKQKKLVLTWPSADYAQAVTIHMCITGHLSVTGMNDQGPIAEQSTDD